MNKATRIEADYPYSYDSRRHVQVGKPHQGEVTKHIYVSTTSTDSGGYYYASTVAHLSFDRARELAHAILAEIGDDCTAEPSAVTHVHNVTVNLPEVGDLPLDYVLAVVQRLSAYAA